MGNVSPRRWARKFLVSLEPRLASAYHSSSLLPRSRSIRFLARQWKKYRNVRKDTGITALESTVLTIPSLLAQTANKVDNSFALSWVAEKADSFKEIPNSNGCRYYEKLDVTIGIVCDEFFWDSISPAAHFVYLTPKNYESVIQKKEIDVLLLLSTWKGKNGEWVGITRKKHSAHQNAMQLIRLCREKKIPVLFYSKEDPPNYSTFLPFAKEADYVITSAAEVILNYEKDLGHNNISSVMFGINPLLHNPIGTYRTEAEKSVIFAGSFNRRYPDRSRDLSVLFDGVLASDYDLHIIDRNYYLDKKYSYPARYQSYVSPSIPHEDLYKFHKLFNWALNVNTVTRSDTMFANRTFELLASGVSVISNYSVGVNSYLPSIYMAHELSEVSAILSAMSPEELYEQQMLGVREVFRSHTCFHRIRDILAPVFPDLPSIDKRKVLVITDVMNDKIQASFERQTYPAKTLILQNELTPEILADYDMVAWMSDEAYYGVYYLEDLINAFKYTHSDFVTKDAFYSNGSLIQGIEHGYVTHMRDRNRSIFWRTAFDDAFFLNPTTSALTLPNGYSIDHLSYYHGDLNFENKKQDYELSVIVPIYNNGAHLFSKCFSSLRRSSIFDKMEIVLVDDGSTDKNTLAIEEDLVLKYPNVSLYRFTDGGSGSASRPRNKGVELATAQYIAFLDPDNELLDDGFAFLLKQAQKGKHDLVFGGIIRLDRRKKIVADYARVWNASVEALPGASSQEHLVKTNFFAVSIQAMVISKDLIVNNKLQQIEGAAGQDTLFSWQLIASAKSIAAFSRPIHIYYAATAGSITNTVTYRYFEKLLLLQKPKIQWLQETGLLDDFMRKRFAPYTIGWVLRKYCQSDIQETGLYLRQYFEYFDPYYDPFADKELTAIRDFFYANDYEAAYSKILERSPNNSNDKMLKVSTHKNRPAQNFPVEYILDENKIYLANLEDLSDGATFAWVVLSAKKYVKFAETGYSSDRKAVFDFSDFRPGTYRIRAFRLTENKKKKSYDAVQVIVRPDMSVTIDDSYTAAYSV